MKIDTIKNGGQSQGGLDSSGGTLSGPLLLCRHPELPLEAATKQYVDQGVQSLGAGNFTTGTLPIARLPAMAGDATSEAGSNIINLVPTGVTAGEYARITVNAKGRVTGTGILSASDLPNLPFSKIASDKPSTLSGYGITDAVNVSGSIMTGPLILAGNPVNGNQLVPKQYIDGMINSLSSARTGDVVRKAYSTTPTGFLKCNGAEVSKTTYSDLYAIIGDSNSSFSMTGGGAAWKNQYEFNTSQSVDIGPWASGTSLPGIFGYSKAIITKNRVYLVGGHNGTNYTSTVYTAPINIDGTLGSWGTTTSLPVNIGEIALFTTKNRVYVVGGYNGSNYQNSVYSAIINTDGTLGTWVLSSNTLPQILRGGSAFVTKTKVYYVCGNNGSGVNTIVYVANLNSDGTIGTWSDSGVTVTGGSSNGEVAIINNRVYVLCGTGTTNIYSSVIGIDGTIGAFSLASNLPSVSRISQVVSTKSRIYVLGGYDNATAISTVYSAPINIDGTIGTWSTGTSLPGGLYGSQAIVTKSKIYLLGGVTSIATWVSTVYVATFSGGSNDYSAYFADDQTNYMMPGSGQPWKQQYQINNSQTGNITGWTSGSNFPTVLASTIPLVTKNRVYLIGGCTSSTTYVSTIYTAPINADGTLGSWTTSTAFPIALAGASAIVTKNRVYVLGGNNASSLNTVYYAPINADGTIGTWVLATALPGVVGYNCSFITKNRVYVLGGGTATVYTAPIATDGTIGTWTTGPSLPVTTSATQVAVTKNRIYMIGGYTTGTTGNIYSATINSDGMIGQWVIDGGMTVSLSHSQVVVFNNHVYMLGGYTNTSNVSTVTYAPIKSDGTLGTWTIGTSLPGVLNQSAAIVTKNRIYLLVGDTNNNAAYVSTVYTAIISEGLNDYSAYYDGSVLPIEPINPSSVFKLPDMSKTDVNGIYHYIKF